jgi:hypothetical protein
MMHCGTDSDSLERAKTEADYICGYSGRMQPGMPRIDYPLWFNLDAENSGIVPENPHCLTPR